jgi:hypothetical protein
VCAALAVPVVTFFWDPPAAAWIDALKAAGARGDLDQMSLLAGESSGLIGARLPAAEIVATLQRELAAAARSLS